MAANEVFDVLGAFVGRPLKADRNSATPLSSSAYFKKWAESQGNLVLSDASASPSSQFAANEIVQGFGGEIRGLICAFTRNGPITTEQLESWAAPHSEIIIVDKRELLVFQSAEGSTSFFDRATGQFVDLPENLIVTSTYTQWRLPGRGSERPRDERFKDLPEDEDARWPTANHFWLSMAPNGTTHAILEAAAKAWGCDAVALALNSDSCMWIDEDLDERFVISSGGSTDIRLDAYKLTRPNLP